MPTPTSGFHEPLERADFSELTTVPVYDSDDLILLEGRSEAQEGFADSVRDKKLREWQADLPKNVYNALCGIRDATWWLANQHKDVSAIGWPASWLGKDRNRTPAGAGQPSSLRERAAQAPAASEEPVLVPNADLEQFDKFARKVCNSPEMAYLTMMALLYKQTGDKRVLAKFQDVWKTVHGHLEAIEAIINSVSE